MTERVWNRIYETLRVDRALKLVWESDRRRATLSAVTQLVSGLLPVASLYLMKLIIDNVVDLVSVGGEALGRVLTYLGAAAGVAILSSIINSLAGWIEQAHAEIVTDHVQDILHKKSIEVDYAYYENPAYHDTLHRAQAEAPFRPSDVLSHVLSLIYSFVALLGVAGLLIATFHWGFVVVLLVTALPVVAIRLRFAEEIFRWHKSRTESERRIDYLNFVLTGTWFAKELRTFGLGNLFSRRSQALRKKLREERLKIASRQTVINLVAQLSQNIVLFVSFGYAVVRALQGQQSVGDIVMLYQAFQRGQGLLQSMMGSVGSLYENNLFLSYLFDFLGVPVSVKSPEQPIPTPPTVASGLVADEVEFRYRDDLPMVLQRASISVPCGSIVAVTGHNGAGKSTLLRLLCRLHDPTGGAVLLDGDDVRDFDIADYRRLVGVLFQDPAAYYDAAADNIRFGKVDETPDRRAIEAAAAESGAHEFISELPRGYDTVLGTWFEDGAELSTGQWKKVALARLFYADPPIMLLDEPTAGLDAGSEKQIMRLLRERSAARAILIVSHRMSTVSLSDYIYVLDDGVVSEEGTHATLIDRNGAYARLCREQAVV